MESDSNTETVAMEVSDGNQVDQNQSQIADVELTNTPAEDTNERKMPEETESTQEHEPMTSESSEGTDVDKVSKGTDVDEAYSSFTSSRQAQIKEDSQPDISEDQTTQVEDSEKHQTPDTPQPRAKDDPMTPMQDNKGHQMPDTPYPRTTHTFDSLLRYISKRLSVNECSKMADILKDETGQDNMGKMTCAYDLFSTMQKRGFLSEGDVLFLCGLLNGVKRHDLIEHIVRFTRETEDTLYTHRSKPEPVKGYQSVEFNVSGKDFSATTKKDVINFRKTVSALLAVPERFVFIADVTPSAGVVITLLIPEYLVQILHNMLTEKRTDVVNLQLSGVDEVKIGNDTITLQGSLVILPGLTNEQNRNNLSQEFKRVSRDLSKANKENHKLQKEIKQHENTQKSLEKEILRLKVELDLEKHSTSSRNNLSNMGAAGDSRNANDLVDESEELLKRLGEFREYLAKVSETNCDKESLLKLLEAHANLTASRVRHEMSSAITSMKLKLQSVMHERAFEGVVTSLQEFAGVPEMRNDPIFHGFVMISKMLSPEERRHLMHGLEWTGPEKEMIEKDAVPFIIMILSKERETKIAAGDENVDDNVNFFNCLRKINRLDLWQLFHMEVNRMRSDQQRSESRNNRPAHGSGINVTAEQMRRMQQTFAQGNPSSDRLFSPDVLLNSVFFKGNRN